MNNFKCRCSALGNIVTGIGFEPIPLTEKQSIKLQELRAKNSQSKEREILEKKLVEIPKNELSTGAKTYLKNWFYGQKFDYQKKFSNKFTEKGKVKEVYSISQLNDFFGFFAVKNEKHFENDFIQGTPDIILKKILDTKNVYYPDGLKIFEKEEETNYIWQIHGYNYLTGRQKGAVVRILVNPPESIIEKETWNFWKEAGESGQPTEEFIDEVRDYFNWEKKQPLSKRIRTFNVETTYNEIKIINEAVRLSRIYIEQLEVEYLTENYNKLT